MLRLSGLDKSFDGAKVLLGISLSVERGDVLALLGPSGSGKTTLLRCLNMLERADAGTLRHAGRDYDLAKVSSADARRYRLKTSFVFQSYNLFANRTALENVTDGLVVARGMARKEAELLGLDSLAKVGLKERAGAYPSELSGGQQQRVGIARAIITDPDVIFLDEPTSALDPETATGILDLLRSLAGQGRTMVLATHQISFAREISSKAMLLEGGTVTESGPAREFFSSPREKRTALFLESAL